MYLYFRVGTWTDDGVFLCLQAATITDAAAAVDSGQIGAACAMAFLYVVRHGAVYYSLGKWVLEWNRQLFDGSDGVNS